MAKKEEAFNNPFGRLKGVKVQKKTPPPPPPKPEPAPAAPQDDEDLFSRAMSGVKTLDGQVSGRQVAAKARPAAQPPQADTEAEGRSRLLDLVSGKVEFALEYTDEYVQGYVQGLDSKVFRQLKAGQLSPEAHLDLHGLNAEQALSSVLVFLRSSTTRAGAACSWCRGGASTRPAAGGSERGTQDLADPRPLKRVVLAFCTPNRATAGRGGVRAAAREEEGRGQNQVGQFLGGGDVIGRQ